MILLYPNFQKVKVAIQMNKKINLFLQLKILRKDKNVVKK